MRCCSKCRFCNIDEMTCSLWKGAHPNSKMKLDVKALYSNIECSFYNPIKKCNILNTSNKIKTIFISLGLSGRSDEDITNDLNRSRENIYELFGSNITIIDNHDCVGPTDANKLWYLGEAIKKLGKCDACYFTKGWKNHNGCLIEMEVCKLYNIDIIYE